jgi:hypothetical protein
MEAKRNPWSDDSGSDSELVIPLDVDPVILKEKPKRKAKGETLPRGEEAKKMLLGEFVRHIRHCEMQISKTYAHGSTCPSRWPAFSLFINDTSVFGLLHLE